MLNDVIYDYNEGMMDKHTYIREMHDVHCTLYDYAEYLPSTDISKIEITDGEVIMTSRKYGVKMACDFKDQRAIPIETLNFGEYEGPDSEMFLKLVDGCAVMFDIGANFGWYTLITTKQYPNLRIDAFEPVLSTYNRLKTNIALNICHNTVLHNFGLSDKSGSSDINFYPEGSGNASLLNLTGKATNSIAAKFKTLNEVAYDKVDIIKCDVEGAELLVLKGGDIVISEKKPIILIELCEKWLNQFYTSRVEIIAYLKARGYSCFTANGEVLSPSNGEAHEGNNYFFLHDEKHKDLIQRYKGAA